ncbi:MAG: PSD1 and planctomycete cytochrome C domain-containing protein [Bryobacteraceae bacterium]
MKVLGRWSYFCLYVVLTAPAGVAQQKVDFAKDVRPILQARCFPCHGDRVQMHGLRLDREADAFRGGTSGVPAITRGNSSQSLLMRYVTGADNKTVMPPTGPRLSTEQIALLRDWIEEGAVWPAEAMSGGMRKGTDHWAFRPVVQPPIPNIKSDWIRNPIDAFLLAKLQERQWKPAAAAAPRALMRRIYLDLTGLPPTPAEQEAYLKRPDVAALVDELLARPAYGERWGRHWLDLARYAETNGYERDATKPNAWRYRDYVIDSFNRDKPFDRFVMEQLAGDELPDANGETFTALGYYRLGPWDDEPADPKTDRFDQLDDIVSTTSQVFLGLTLGCARCHDHKFEPLTARDYYSMVAIFNGLERPRDGRTEFDLPVGTWAQIDALNERDRRIQDWEKRSAAVRTEARERLLVSGSAKLPPDAVAAFRVKPQERSEEQKKLAEKYEKQLSEETGASLTTVERASIEGNQQAVDQLRRATPDLPRAYYLNEPKPEPPATYLLVRGKAEQLGPLVPAATPEVMGAQPGFPATPARSSLRRLTLARWITSRQNTLTARVMVNRVWQHHFGEGLVRTPSDFGVMGERPTHPELLDWLATWFMDNGWSVKKLHRLILASNAYRMGKEWNPEYGEKDPEDRMLWRMPYQRLEVEAIRDSALSASGELNPQMSGPSMYPQIPAAALEGNSDPDKIWKASDEAEASRRTVYAFLKRSMVVPFLEVLDLCDTSRSAAKRQNTSVATQALTLFNGDFINLQARRFAARLRREAGENVEAQIDLAYRLALARPATAKEVAVMGEFVQRESLEEMCRVIYNLNEFAYVD